MMAPKGPMPMMGKNPTKAPLDDGGYPDAADIPELNMSDEEQAKDTASPILGAFTTLAQFAAALEKANDPKAGEFKQQLATMMQTLGAGGAAGAAQPKPGAAKAGAGKMAFDPFKPSGADRSSKAVPEMANSEAKPLV